MTKHFLRAMLPKVLQKQRTNNITLSLHAAVGMHDQNTAQ